ncbi:PaaI family thioesterase [Rhodococcus sp. X156]|uniref:PaaI family thioesterase n=1 Tax=Rhodococcus sp. X156 TaxID=2499145 RepID=UPI000FD9045E|nr:PaaI family thioesterase [Rhodococcus sp. X156]
MPVESSATTRTHTPESLFRVGPPDDLGDVSITRMRTGAWMIGPDGQPAAGAIGVLVDDSVGHRIFTQRPADKASVTSELSMDIVRMPDVDPRGTDERTSSPDLRAESRMLHAHRDGGVAECRVLDDQDRLIAVATTWCRYIPLPEGVTMPTKTDDWPLTEPSGDRDLFGTLGARLQPTEHGTDLVLAPSLDLTNPLSMTHGGVLLGGTEIAAHHAIAEIMPEGITSSVRMNYLRPAPMDAELTFSVEIVHRGRSVSIARVTTRGTEGKACTIGTVTSQRQG